MVPIRLPMRYLNRIFVFTSNFTDFFYEHKIRPLRITSFVQEIYVAYSGHIEAYWVIFERLDLKSKPLFL